MIVTYKANDKIYIKFDEFIKKGNIEVDEDKRNNVLNYQFKNSDFEIISLKKLKGKITIRIIFDYKIIYKKTFNN